MNEQSCARWGFGLYFRLINQQLSTAEHSGHVKIGQGAMLLYSILP